MKVRQTPQVAPEPPRPAITTAAVLATSGICVAAIVAIAWLGLSSVGDGDAKDPSVTEARPTAGAAIVGDRAAAHRRQVFEERRARFESRKSAQVAGAGLEHPHQ